MRFGYWTLRGPPGMMPPIPSFSTPISRTMKIVDIAESTRPIKSDIRNAYIDFSKMTLSLVTTATRLSVILEKSM